MSKFKHAILLFLILILCAYLRLTGINWDQNQHLHPDERFLTMVTAAMKWPEDLSGYFDTDSSTLNPHNIGYGFYVYGTWPLILIKAIAETIGKYNYTDITLVGRFISGILDIATTILVYAIARTAFKNTYTALMAAFLYTLTATAIQQAHFFTVDPYETFTVALTLFFMARKNPGYIVGIAAGMAIGAKVSSVLLLVPVGLWYLYRLFKEKKRTVIVDGLLYITSLLITIRLLYPYLFTGGILPTGLNPKLLANWKELKGFTAPGSYFPPAVQWTGTIPWLFPAHQLFWFGLGLPHGILTIIGFLLLFKAKKNLFIAILLVQVLTVFGYQGYQTAKTLRYFYPMIPSLIILAGYGISQKKYLLYALPVLLIWPLSFSSIYQKDHTRVAASKWIYENIPRGSTIAGESWDDYLPVTLDANHIAQQYSITTMPVTGPDTDGKLTQMQEEIYKADYIILSSNRGYGSMTQVADMYPKTNTYYESLVDGSLGFVKIAEFTSRPNIPLPISPICIDIPTTWYGRVVEPLEECTQTGISFVDDYGEELWTVYEHPKVLIFKKI